MEPQNSNKVTNSEQYAAALARLKRKFAERQVAKAGFAAMCERIATEPRSAFGAEFTLSFEEIGLDLETLKPSALTLNRPLGGHR
jgi:hypothetical protein